MASLFSALSKKCKEVELLKKAMGPGVGGDTGDVKMLLEAVVVGNKAKVEKVLLAGIDADTVHEGVPVLHAAVEVGTQEIVAILIRLGATVNKTNPNDCNRTALHVAALCNKEFVAAQLIINGAEVDARDEEGNTPLHLSATRAHTSLCHYLIAKGANIHLKNTQGVTPMDFYLNSTHHPGIEEPIGGTVVTALQLRKLFDHHAGGKEYLTEEEFANVFAAVDTMGVPQQQVWKGGRVSFHVFAIEALKIAKW